MRWVGSTPPAAVAESVRLLFELACKQGADEPYGLVFLDSEGLWRNAIAELTLVQRRGCVAFALDDGDLVAASRWCIGGGVLLPPSLSRISAACRAASEAARLPQWTAEPVAAGELGDCGGSLRVGLQPQGLWDALAGVRGQLEVLTALAAAIERPAVIGPGRKLIVTETSRAVVEDCWRNLNARPMWATDSSCLTFEESDCPSEDSDFPCQSLPVVHWPSGRIAGKWRVNPADPDHPWSLEAGNGKEIRTQAVTTRSHLDSVMIDTVRIHGIPSSDLERDGSPGAIVVEGVAREAGRIGSTLWIPGVSRIAGGVIRRWGLPVWVDGPIISD